jgi:hypothetical protein
LAEFDLLGFFAFFAAVLGGLCSQDLYRENREERPQRTQRDHATFKWSNDQEFEGSTLARTIFLHTFTKPARPFFTMTFVMRSGALQFQPAHL